MVAIAPDAVQHWVDLPAEKLRARVQQLVSTRLRADDPVWAAIRKNPVLAARVRGALSGLLASIRGAKDEAMQRIWITKARAALDSSTAEAAADSAQPDSAPAEAVQSDSVPADSAGPDALAQVAPAAFSSEPDPVKPVNGAGRSASGGRPSAEDAPAFSSPPAAAAGSASPPPSRPLVTPLVFQEPSQR